MFISRKFIPSLFTILNAFCGFMSVINSRAAKMVAGDPLHPKTRLGAMISEIVRVTDPVAYLSSLLVIVVACLLAAWIPSSRAAHVDPMTTLRQE